MLIYLHNFWSYSRMFIFHKIFTIDLSKYAGIFMGIVLNISINLGKTIDSLDLLLLSEDDTSLHLFWRKVL